MVSDQYQAQIDQDKVGVENRANRRRFFRKIRRKLGVRAEKIISKRQSAAIINSFAPRLKRAAYIKKIRNKSRISLKNFSLIDNPENTLNSLAEIARRNFSRSTYYIDFEDEYCFDIGPYLILGLMRNGMKPLSNGGKIHPRVFKVLMAINLDRFLKMKPKAFGSIGVYPFPVCRYHELKAYTSGFETHESAKEKHARRFSERLDGWLKHADLMLSEEGGDSVRTMISEILDNSRHATSLAKNGEWAMTGFMAVRADGRGNEVYVCHLAISSIGSTISSGLSNCEDPDVRKRIEQYVSTHRNTSNKYNDDTLRTVCSLIDGISKQGVKAKSSLGGCGMSSLITMLNVIGASSDPMQEPIITIVSGSSCLRMAPPYNCVIPYPQGDSKTYFQPFNESSSLRQPPDDRYVYELSSHFPGTIVCLRFTIDPSELRDYYQQVK